MSITTDTILNISIQDNHFSFNESVGRELMDELQEHFKDKVKVWIPEPFEPPHTEAMAPSDYDRQYKAVDSDELVILLAKIATLRENPDKSKRVDETV